MWLAGDIADIIKNVKSCVSRFRGFEVLIHTPDFAIFHSLAGRPYKQCNK